MDVNPQTQKHLEQKYYELQMVTQQLQNVREQLHKTDERIAEVGFVIDSLGDFSLTKEDDEVLLPVTNGIFTKAKLQNPKELLVNVGAETVVVKSIPDTQEMLRRQLLNIQEFRERLSHVVERLYLKSEELKDEIRNVKV